MCYGPRVGLQFTKFWAGLQVSMRSIVVGVQLVFSCHVSLETVENAIQWESLVNDELFACLKNWMFA